MSVLIQQADSLQWIQEARTSDLCGTVDCVITDPPYWTLNKWREIGTTTRLGGHRNKEQRDNDKWFDTIDYDDLWQFMLALADVMAKNSHAYIMCDHEVMPILLLWARDSELSNIFRYAKPLVWDKMDCGMGYHWRARHEYIVMLEKGKRRLNNLSLPDVLAFKRVQGNHYPTEKPIGLIETLLLNSTNKDELVIDPFCGSGVVGVAAQMHGRNAIILDKSDKAIDLSKQRIELDLLCQTK